MERRIPAREIPQTLRRRRWSRQLPTKSCHAPRKKKIKPRMNTNGHEFGKQIAVQGRSFSNRWRGYGHLERTRTWLPRKALRECVSRRIWPEKNSIQTAAKLRD